jgi:hypothetical protein
VLNTIGAIEEWVVNASSVSDKGKLCLLPLLLLFLCAPVGALASVTYGLRANSANGPTRIGNGFVVTTDAAGEATRICMSRFSILSCIDPRTWKRVWSEKTPYGSVDTDLYVSDNILLYAGGGGAWTIYGTSLDNGQILWHKSHQSFVLATGRGKVFAANGTGVIAFAAGSGIKDWEFGPIAPGVSPGAMFFWEGKLFTASYILDAETGKLVKMLHSDSGAFAASRGRVFGADSHGTLRTWNAASGALIWSRTVHSAKIGEQLAANSNDVFAVFYKDYAESAHQGVLKAYNAADGRVLWGRELKSDTQTLPFSPIGADNSHVYLIVPSSTTRGFRLIGLESRTGKLLWSCSIAKTAYGPPVPTRDFVYLTVDRTTLVVIDKRDGKIVKSIPFPK